MTVNLKTLSVAVFLSVFSFMVPVPVQATAFDDPGARAGATGGGTGGLVPSKPIVDGGAIAVGSTSQVVMLFRNEHSQPVEVGAVNLYPSSTVSASVALNDCAKEPLAPGAECPIALSVKGLQTGAWRIELLVRHSGRSRVVTATVNGTVEAGADTADQLQTDIQTVPDKIEFGTLATGKPLVKSIILRNITSTDVTVKDVAIQASANAEYNLETNCDKLESGQACLVSLSWAPNQKGPSEGFVVIHHSGPTAVTSIPVTGKYEPEVVEKAATFPESVAGKGLLVSSAEDVEFGEGVANEASITVSLVNVGDADMELQQINLSGTENGLSILKKGCVSGRVLAPVEACPLTVMWSPVREGDVRDDIQISHNGARGVLVLPVKGTAEKAVNKDSKAIIARDGEVAPEVDRTEALQGFVVTSHAPSRAIISGPGGSRVVVDGQELVLGGVSWKVDIVPNGVELRAGKDKVLLLFDRSLSTGSRLSTGSSGSSSSSSSSSSTSTTETTAGGT